MENTEEVKVIEGTEEVLDLGVEVPEDEITEEVADNSEEIKEGE